MLIKLNADEDFIDRLREVTGERTGSKAVAAAYLAYIDQLDMIARLERENGRLREAVRVHQQVIRRARESAAALLDHVAQGDLINE